MYRHVVEDMEGTLNHDSVGLSSLMQIAPTHLSLSQTPRLSIPEGQAGGAAMQKAAHEFEGYFLSNLLKVMRETIPKGAIENKGGDFFYSLYDQEIGRLAAESGGLGLAGMIEEYTKKNTVSLKS